MIIKQKLSTHSLREGVTYFFLIDAYRSRRSPVNEARSAERKKPSLEPYQTASTVYFILGILSKDFWNQGIMLQKFEPKVLGDILKMSRNKSFYPYSTSEQGLEQFIVLLKLKSNAFCYKN